MKDHQVALKDMLGIIDNKLVDIFNRPSFDADRARKPLLRGIARTLDQFEGGKVNAPGRWWFVKNDVVALTVKLDGDVWTARPLDPTEVYTAGTTVTVMKIDGATAVVWKGP